MNELHKLISKKTHKEKIRLIENYELMSHSGVVCHCELNYILMKAMEETNVVLFKNNKMFWLEMAAQMLYKDIAQKHIEMWKEIHKVK